MKLSALSKAIIRETNPKQVKLALKQVAKNTLHTKLISNTVALNSAVGNLVSTLNPYILGEQFSKVNKQDVFNNMGTVGGHLIALANLLKVKLPTPTKKTKLVGTRTQVLLKFMSLSQDLLLTEEEFLSNVPITVTTREGKAPDGAVTTRTLESIDRLKWTERETTSQESMKAIVGQMVALYWQLSFDMLGHPPQAIFDAVYAGITDSNAAPVGTSIAA